VIHLILGAVLTIAVIAAVALGAWWANRRAYPRGFADGVFDTQRRLARSRDHACWSAAHCLEVERFAEAETTIMRKKP
jgi:hypothetical protein